MDNNETIMFEEYMGIIFGIPPEMNSEIPEEETLYHWNGSAYVEAR